MYTEIELSEFITRCRLKVSSIAFEISERQRYGQDVTGLINDSTLLRIFTNAVYSDSLQWTQEDLYKRIEHITDRFNLISRPTYSQDLMNKFAPLSKVVVEGNLLMELPKTGEGYVYLNNGTITLIPEKEHTLLDLPIA